MSNTVCWVSVYSAEQRDAAQHPLTPTRGLFCRITERTLLTITYETFSSSPPSHFSASPPKIWIRPNIIIPPPSLLLLTPHHFNFWLLLPANSGDDLSSLVYISIGCVLSSDSIIYYFIDSFIIHDIDALVATNQSLNCKDCNSTCLKYSPIISPFTIIIIIISPYRDRSACQAASTSAYRFFSEGFPELAP